MQVAHPSTVVVPRTTNLVDAVDALRIRFHRRGHRRHDSDVLIDQVRAIDNRRLIGRPLGRAPQSFMARVGHAIREVLDLVD